MSIDTNRRGPVGIPWCTAFKAFSCSLRNLLGSFVPLIQIGQNSDFGGQGDSILATARIETSHCEAKAVAILGLMIYRLCRFGFLLSFTALDFVCLEGSFTSSGASSTLPSQYMCLICSGDLSFSGLQCSFLNAHQDVCLR